MKKRHSFTDYVADRFYNEMFSAVKSYAIQNKDSLDLYSRVVQNIRYIELSDIKVVNVFVNNQPDQRIAFDVIVDAEIELQDYPDDKMIELSKRIKLIVDDKSRYTDWSTRDDIKANLQVDLILLLDEFDYPPVTIDDVYKEVLEQAENFKKYA